jgi:hypothetical protein
MNAADLEVFRHRIITLLVAAGSIGARVPTLKNGLTAAGYEPTDTQVADELDYLAGKGLVETKDKLISPENLRWKITANGRDYAAQQGHA